MRSGLRFTLIALLFCAIASMSQVTKGSISGTVVDPSSAVVPEAQVKITEVQTGAVQTSTSDSAGNFRFNLINPGNYTLEISKTGFATLTHQNIQVNPGVDSGVGSLKLTVGSSTEIVDVSAATPLVETTQTQVTSNFTTQNFVNLPGMVDNAGMDRLALLVPGVSSTRDNNFSNTNGAAISVNGLRGRNNDQQIDGQNNNDNSVGGPALFLTNSEFVGEYQIVTNNFGAEYGRNAGSVVNVITKSGTNNFHGSIYGSENNSALNSLTNAQKRFDELKKPPRMNDEFAGFTIGGPVKKDKLFFFGGFDEEVTSQKTIFSTGNITPTPLGLSTLTACFPDSTTLAALKAYGPYGVTAGNPTPSGTLQTKAVAGCSGVQFAGVQRTISSPFHQFDWIFKMDYVGAKDTFSGRYLFNKQNNFNIDEGNAVAGYFMNQPSQNEQARLNWTHNLTGRMVNEVSLTYGRLNAEFGGNALGTVPTIAGFDQALAAISVGSGNLGFGPPNTMPQGRIVNTWQVQDNWNYVLGKHTLKAGVNWTYQRSPNIMLPNINGSFSYTSWSNFITNTPSTVSIALGSPNLDFREYDTFWYFSDEYKLKSNLTLNYGLTYTYYGQPANLFNQSDTKQQTSSQPFWDPSLPLSVTTFPKLDAPKNQLGPSVGFAWSPQGGSFLTGNGKTVIRGGFRRAYDPPFYNIYLNMASSAPQLLSQSISGATAAGIALPSDPTGPNVRSLLASYLVTGIKDPRTFTQTRISPNFGPDHVNSWSFGIQREIAKDVVIESRYVGNSARNLFQTVNGNPYVAGLAAAYPNLVPAGVTACTDASKPGYGRENCDYGRVRLRDNGGYSDYNGWQTELRANNLFHQLMIRAGYTFGKTTDNVSEIFGTGGAGNTTPIAQNPFDTNKGEHSLSGLDVPHRFTLTLSESLPFFNKQHGVFGHLAGGWAISGTYTLSSGQPYTPLQYCIAYGACGGGLVPDSGFDTAFSFYTYEGLRPFWGNQSAPASSVGAYAGDVCNYWGGAACALSSDTLLDWTAANSSQGATTTPINKNNVRYILNAATSQSIFGTPFGNVGRNAARDFWTNSANATILKSTKIAERVSAEFQVTFYNVLNHRSFASVDPYVDDAGNKGYYNQFGDPSYTDASGRQIYFHVGIRF